LIRALVARALPVTQIPAALAEWRNPPHPEFAAGERTGWRLFNAVTEALKEGSYMDLPSRTQSLHGLMDLACGLTLPRSWRCLRSRSWRRRCDRTRRGRSGQAISVVHEVLRAGRRD
jgi:hypothetical protein